jgi:hypothetical protein
MTAEEWAGWMAIGIVLLILACVFLLGMLFGKAIS